MGAEKLMSALSHILYLNLTPQSHSKITSYKSRMEFEAGGHGIHAWKHIVGSGNSFDSRHIMKQLGICEVEAVREE